MANIANNLSGQEDENSLKYGAFNLQQYVQERLRLLYFNEVYLCAPQIGSHITLKVRAAINEQDYTFTHKMRNNAIVVDAVVGKVAAEMLSCQMCYPNQKTCKSSDPSAHFFRSGDNTHVACQPSCFNLMSAPLSDQKQSVFVRYSERFGTTYFANQRLFQWITDPRSRSADIKRRVSNFGTGFNIEKKPFQDMFGNEELMPQINNYYCKFFYGYFNETTGDCVETNHFITKYHVVKYIDEFNRWATEFGVDPLEKLEHENSLLQPAIDNASVYTYNVNAWRSNVRQDVALLNVNVTLSDLGITSTTRHMIWTNEFNPRGQLVEPLLVYSNVSNYGFAPPTDSSVGIEVSQKIDFKKKFSSRETSQISERPVPPQFLTDEFGFKLNRNNMSQLDKVLLGDKVNKILSNSEFTLATKIAKITGEIVLICAAFKTAGAASLLLKSIVAKGVSSGLKKLATVDMYLSEKLMWAQLQCLIRQKIELEVMVQAAATMGKFLFEGASGLLDFILMADVIFGVSDYVFDFVLDRWFGGDPLGFSQILTRKNLQIVVEKMQEAFVHANGSIDPDIQRNTEVTVEKIRQLFVFHQTPKSTRLQAVSSFRWLQQQGQNNKAECFDASQVKTESNVDINKIYPDHTEFLVQTTHDFLFTNYPHLFSEQHSTASSDNVNFRQNLNSALHKYNKNDEHDSAINKIEQIIAEKKQKKTRQRAEKSATLQVKILLTIYITFIGVCLSSPSLSAHLSLLDRSVFPKKIKELHIYSVFYVFVLFILFGSIFRKTTNRFISNMQTNLVAKDIEFLKNVKRAIVEMSKVATSVEK